MNPLFLRPSVVVLLLIWAWTTEIRAQATSTYDAPAYYMDLAPGNGHAVHVLSEQQLNLKYEDPYGMTDYLTVQLFDWEQKLMETYQLDKSFGINYYAIEMPSLEPDKLYYLKANNEMGQSYQISFRYRENQQTNMPEVAIHVNPVKMACDQEAGKTQVEFYATIKGGRGPYEMHWYVLDESMQSLLYQPRIEKLKDASKGMMITVAEWPDYYVLLQVDDQCGNTTRNMVEVTCQNEKQVYHSVVLEPLEIPDITTDNSK